jgi:molecular chaperone GrpE (heat shock protein)
MDIILQGQHEGQEALESLERVLQLFKDRYSINGYREIHLTVTLLDEQGEEVELIDSDTHQPYRVFEVYRAGYELAGKKGVPMLQLVVDNTK